MAFLDINYATTHWLLFERGAVSGLPRRRAHWQPPSHLSRSQTCHCRSWIAKHFWWHVRIMQSVLGMDLPFLTEEGSLLVILPLNYLTDAGEIVCSFLLSQIQTLLLLLLLLQIWQQISEKIETKGVVKMYWNVPQYFWIIFFLFFIFFRANDTIPKCTLSFWKLFLVLNPFPWSMLPTRTPHLLSNY